MNQILFLTEKLNKLSVNLSLNGNSLKINAPLGILTLELEREIRENKAALMTELKRTNKPYQEINRHKRHNCLTKPNSEINKMPPPKQCWNPETASLIQWFLEEGQHLIPDEPFQLSPWQKISNPKLFKEAIFFGISIGPEQTKLRHGTFTADLRRLKELFGK